MITNELLNWVDDIFKKIDEKQMAVVKRIQDKIPYTVIDGVYDDKGMKNINWWTNGFFAGIMWHMYMETGNDLYKQTAQKQILLLDKALENLEALDHDVGFMWLLSSGIEYRLFKDEMSKRRTLKAANTLFSRYNLNGKFIRSWNYWGDDEHLGWTIIDCMMNLPLLYWAAEETKDDRYKFIAMSHADSTMENHIREDGSVCHIIRYDPVMGNVLDEIGGQGYGVASSWSRGQAWALYGFILSYIYTKKVEYLNTAKKVAHYFIANVCNDWLPKCDFRSPKEPVIYDSTAGAIAACGLLEIAKVVPEFEKECYFQSAIKLLKALEENFCNWNKTEDGILIMGTESYHIEQGRHIPIIYGDYYFIEAIYKLKRYDDLLLYI